MKIRLNEDNKSEICEKILRSLPMWFGIESAIIEYIQDVETRPMIVAEVDSENIGFLSLTFHNKWTAEIHVMGVLPQNHRKKVGTNLVAFAKSYLLDHGFQYLTVKTLSESRPNEEYDRTRNFYYSVGFVPVEEFKTLWGEDNPCLLMIMDLKPK